MGKIFISILLVLSCLEGFSQAKGPQSNYKLEDNGNWVTTKNYYLLNLFKNNKDVSALLANDAELACITKEKLSRIATTLSDCKSVSCYTDALKFSPEEINKVSQVLTRLYNSSNLLSKLVSSNLIPSGSYYQFGNLPEREFLIKSWEQDANYINYTIGVYVDGNKPNYPLIDSISFKVKAPAYAAGLHTLPSVIVGDSNLKTLFFQPSLSAALLSLEINERNQAADFEPMALTVNKAAVDQVKKVKWNTFPYSVILIPGAGPDNFSTPLSAPGMLRCRLAAQAYQEGKAPFIVVSGGNVHPYKTVWNEALEMKKYLINTLNIPEYAVIMEPHARHTTTNMRNTVRLIYRYGMPFEKLGLIITDRGQTNFIMGMNERCMKELGYLPYKLGARLSDTRVEFLPSIESLQIDPNEPMDP